MQALRAMSQLHDGMSRRRFLGTVGASLLAIEAGLPYGARAEEKFTMATTGGSWGEGLKASFIVATDFEKRFKVPVAYSHQLESVAASKILATCGSPVFTVTSLANAEAMLLADGGCIVGYNRDLVPNLQDIQPVLILEKRPEPGVYFAPYVFVVFGATWNTKLAKKPGSFKDLWSSEYKGRVGVPAYGWYGIYWLHAINKLFGGNEDNVTPGVNALAELVQKNNAVIVENVDHMMKLFQREEIAIAPFFNGRTFMLQDQGVPVGITYPEKSLVIGNGYVIAKGSAFVEAAQGFVNDTLNERYQIEMVRRFKYPPANRRVKLPPELERVRVTEKELEGAARVDWKKINDYRSAYLERWNKEVLGKG